MQEVIPAVINSMNSQNFYSVADRRVLFLVINEGLQAD